MENLYFKHISFAKCLYTILIIIYYIGKKWCVKRGIASSVRLKLVF